MITQPERNWGITTPKLNKRSISDMSYNELTEDLKGDHIRGPPLDSQSVSEIQDVSNVEMGSLSVYTSPIDIDLLKETNSDIIFSEDNHVLPFPTISELAKDNDDTLSYESHDTDLIISGPNVRQCNVIQHITSPTPNFVNSKQTILEQQLKKRKKS
ncbi:unnamed protein product [Mytilus coruscus]|uniref:Uncharacterized protein n=1 Tax=Mytilus coruscus TaxID=42192 RepID=A0A6J8CTV2_MYTCO|nr:unnamed protein product [Mytilus coruscus]